MILSLLFFLIGYLTFPVLFYFQKLFKLPVPDLEKLTFHIHHSFYGLLLIIIGVLLTTAYKEKWVYLGTFGLGIIMHHEITEPGLKGLGKFIYLKRK